MWPAVVRAIRHALRHAFLFENVRGLLKPACADYFESIKRNLEHPACIGAPDDVSYPMTGVSLDTANYGVPQKRHSVLMQALERLPRFAGMSG
jgi:DNA (cytosine-5)-methyltransferase 1